MAYFDDPERMESWQQELKALRAERQRRQSGAAQPETEAAYEAQPEAKSAHEAESVHEIAQRIASAYTEKQEAPYTPTRRTVRSPLREEITFDQLEMEAGVRKPPAAASRDLGRQKELAAERRMI